MASHEVGVVMAQEDYCGAYAWYTLWDLADDNGVKGFWTAQGPMYIPLWLPVSVIVKMALNPKLRGHRLYVYTRNVERGYMPPPLGMTPVRHSKLQWVEVYSCTDVGEPWVCPELPSAGSLPPPP